MKQNMELQNICFEQLCHHLFQLNLGLWVGPFKRLFQVFKYTNVQVIQAFKSQLNENAKARKQEKEELEGVLLRTLEQKERAEIIGDESYFEKEKNELENFIKNSRKAHQKAKETHQNNVMASQHLEELLREIDKRKRELEIHGETAGLAPKEAGGGLFENNESLDNRFNSQEKKNESGNDGLRLPRIQEVLDSSLPAPETKPHGKGRANNMEEVKEPETSKIETETQTLFEVVLGEAFEELKAKEEKQRNTSIFLRDELDKRKTENERLKRSLKQVEDKLKKTEAHLDFEQTKFFQHSSDYEKTKRELKEAKVREETQEERMKGLKGKRRVEMEAKGIQTENKQKVVEMSTQTENKTIENQKETKTLEIGEETLRISVKMDHVSKQNEEIQCSFIDKKEKSTRMFSKETQTEEVKAQNNMNQSQMDQNPFKKIAAVKSLERTSSLNVIQTGFKASEKFGEKSSFQTTEAHFEGDESLFQNEAQIKMKKVPFKELENKTANLTIENPKRKTGFESKKQNEDSSFSIQFPLVTFEGDLKELKITKHKEPFPNNILSLPRSLTLAERQIKRRTIGPNKTTILSLVPKSLENNATDQKDSVPELKVSQSFSLKAPDRPSLKTQSIFLLFQQQNQKNPKPEPQEPSNNFKLKEPRLVLNGKSKSLPDIQASTKKDLKRPSHEKEAKDPFFSMFDHISSRHKEKSFKTISKIFESCFGFFPEEGVFENFEEFKSIFQRVSQMHLPCGENCLHLKRFYEKLAFLGHSKEQVVMSLSKKTFFRPTRVKVIEKTMKSTDCLSLKNLKHEAL